MSELTKLLDTAGVELKGLLFEYFHEIESRNAHNAMVDATAISNHVMSKLYMSAPEQH